MLLCLWVQVAPNPANERVQVRVSLDVQGFAVDLYDLAGRALRHWNVAGVAAELSLGGLAKGIYLLRVQVAGEVEVLRLAVE